MRDFHQYLRTVLLACAAGLLLLPSAVRAEDPAPPPAIKFQEMREGWFTVMLVTPAKQAGEAAFEEEISLGLLMEMGAGYTQGKTVLREHIPCLVVYRLNLVDATGRQLLANGKLPAALQAVTPASDLRLELLDLRTLKSLYQIQPFDLNATLQTCARKKSIYDAIMQKRYREISMNNLHQLAIGITMWCVDHDETFPNAVTWADDLGAERELRVHPVSGEAYLYNRNLPGKQRGTIKDPEKTPMLWEAHPDAEGIRCVAYVDGSVNTADAADWQALVKKYGLK